MTRIMYDSVTVADLPPNGDLYAGYANGHYRNIEAVRARFPGKTVVSIAVNVSADADVLDVERFDATPDEAPGWVARQRARGADPTVYCIESAWGDVVAAFRRQGIPEPHYWLAHYDRRPVIPFGAIAKQFANPLSSGGHFDISVVADHWPGIDKEDDMTEEDRRMLREIHGLLTQGIPLFGTKPLYTYAVENEAAVAALDAKVDAR